MSRGMQAAAAALLSLQRTGASLIEAAQSRAHVIAQMEDYMRIIGVDAGALPPVIHIAGTKGKGSTASMCESILRASGMRTALYSSPHLVTVRERFRLDGRPVPESLYLRHFWETWDTLHESGTNSASNEVSAQSSRVVASMPGYFHFLTLLAFRIFQGERVDVAVLEVGLGGRLDATNVVRTPVACGITTLDFDHTEVLGETLPLIAREKAGIFKRGVPAFSVPQRADALAVLREEAELIGTSGPLRVVDATGLQARARSSVDTASFPVLGLDGAFQRTNAALAVALAEEFLLWKCSGRASSVSSIDAAAPIQPLSAQVLHGLRTARWPGRAHILPFSSAPNATLYLDGAHTERSLRLCVQWFSSHVKNASYVSGTHGVDRIEGGSGVQAKSCTAAPLESSVGVVPARHELHLLFYCGPEKDALQLLLPLSAVPFSHAVFTAPDWVRPSRHPLPTAAETLAGFRSRRARAGDTHAVAALDAASTEVGHHAAEVSAAQGCGPRRSEVTVGQPALSTMTGKTAWPVALWELWHASHTDPRLAKLRVSLANPPADYAADTCHIHDPPLTSASEAGTTTAHTNAQHVTTSWSLPDCEPPTAVAIDVPAALAALRKLTAAHPDVQHHILVTGSLYLVGAVLEAMGYDSDS